MNTKYAEIENRDWQAEVDARVSWLKEMLKSTGAKGFVFGNSGGKDSALVGVLCRLASENTMGVVMPCNTMQNFESDKSHASLLAVKFDIHNHLVVLDRVYEHLSAEMSLMEHEGPAGINMAPRLRMTALYALALQYGRLVVGTGNRSEIYTGYFTKYGDGGYDINPIADLTASEVYLMSKFLKIPDEILEKAPSAGLLEGQTDEGEMGFSYKVLDEFLLGISKPPQEVLGKINHMNKISEHKRRMPVVYCR